MSQKIDVRQQHKIIGNTPTQKAKDFQTNVTPENQWFHSGGNLGLFIHYGISCMSGHVDISWGMMKNTPYDQQLNNSNKLDTDDYFALAKDFQPSNYKPHKWLKAAKEAGFTYAVLTTKHHDGFCLWPSKAGDFNTSTYAESADYVRQFVEACQDVGLKVGLYFSPPDWYFLRKIMPFDYHAFMQWSKSSDKMPEQLKRDYISTVRTQIIELLTDYGTVDILWFDGKMTGLPDETVITIDEIRQFQPDILVNDRLHGYGDFVTPERVVTGIPGGTWEKCEIWEDSDYWGYTHGKHLKSVKWLLDDYTSVAEAGGNYLVNVPLSPDGTMTCEYYAKMKEIKEMSD